MSLSKYQELRTRNTELNNFEFEARKVRLESSPQVLFVELTENCNFACEMCRAAGPFQPSRNMSFDLFRRIADELFPYAQIVDLRGWGESTILKSFRSYVDYSRQFGCRLRIVTNLSLTNDDLWRYLVESDFIVSVSFDAAEPATFARLRQGAKLDRILHNLRVMVEHSRKLNKSTEWLYLNTVVQRLALPEIEQILRVAHELGLRRVHLQPVSLPHTHPDHLSNHVAEVVAMMDRVYRLADELGLLLVVGAALDDSLALSGYAAKTCTHPWMYCYFNYQGQVGFCDHLIGHPGEQYLLGDMRQHSFREIWNNEQYLRLRGQHQGWQNGISEEFEECNWCYKNRYVDFDDAVYTPYQKYVVSNRTVPRLYAIRPVTKNEEPPKSSATRDATVSGA